MKFLNRGHFEKCVHLRPSIPWYLKDDSFPLDDVEEYQMNKKLLWTSPELLRMTTRPNNGTQSGDIYSLGIILQEVVYRTMPFNMETMTPKGNIG